MPSPQIMADKKALRLSNATLTSHVDDESTYGSLKSTVVSKCFKHYGSESIFHNPSLSYIQYVLTRNHMYNLKQKNAGLSFLSAGASSKTSCHLPPKKIEAKILKTSLAALIVGFQGASGNSNQLRPTPHHLDHWGTPTPQPNAAPCCVPHDPWQGTSPAREKPQEWRGPGGDKEHEGSCS